MILEFGNYKIDVDVEKTKLFYETAEEITDGCSCDGCQNYMLAINLFPQSVKDFFNRLGIDLRKAPDVFSYCSEDDGKALFYGGFYHICGRSLTSNDCWNDNGALHSISEGYSVGFTNNVHLLEAGFPMPAFQIEIFFHNVPWLLKKKNPYP